MEQKKIMYFYTDSCPACRRTAPILDAAAKRMEGFVDFEKINAAEDGAAQRYGVRSVPTALFMKDGREIRRFTGSDEISAAVEGLAPGDF